MSQLDAFVPMGQGQITVCKSKRRTGAFERLEQKGSKVMAMVASALYLCNYVDRMDRMDKECTGLTEKQQ